MARLPGRTLNLVQETGYFSADNNKNKNRNTLMCGITGIITPSPEDNGDTIIRMTDAIAHRGPDDFGYISLNPGRAKKDINLHQLCKEKARICLGHRRLSIIDVKGTRQPLTNEDGTVWTVFNGEIYNYLELSEKLIAKGHVLKEKGDTEVLVHLWEEYKEDMPRYLVGMFAFAIYDVKQNILFLARDRFGQKPLFYWQNRGRLAFSSELQSFLTIKEFANDSIDPVSIAQYFRYGYIPNPRTVYKNTFSLPPGSYLKQVDSSTITVTRYWKPEVKGNINSINYEELQSKLDESVRLRLRTDVPLGMFLSGGIDSSLITASAVAQSRIAPKTFTISTGEYWCDESKEAQITADYLQTDHHTLRVEPDFIETSNHLARHYGQPFADFSSIPTFYISKATRKHVKVALSGDGGDELFAGYGQYLNSRLYNFWGLIPFRLKKLAASFFHSLPFKKSSHIPDSILSAFSIPGKGENNTPLYHHFWREKGFSGEFSKVLSERSHEDVEIFVKYYNESPSPDPVDRWLETDQRMYLCDDILTKVDIASMAVSLECRAPFLDHHLAEYANNISSHVKIRDHTTKDPLRKIARYRLPREILNLPKKGFTLPLGDWFRRSLKDWAYTTIFDNKTAWNYFLEEKFVNDLWDVHQRGGFNHESRLWTIISLCLWNDSNKKRI